MARRVIIIGGGVAGMKAAITLKQLGFMPMLIEKSNTLGGELNSYETICPGDYSTRKIIDDLSAELADNNIKTLLCTEVIDVKNAENNTIEVYCACGSKFEVEALIIATGIQWNSPYLTTEYGYGVVEDVIALNELKLRLQEGELFTMRHKKVKNVAIIHCVGSRTVRRGVEYCSKLCCSSALSTAIKLKESLGADSNVYEFFTDMRVSGSDGERLYSEARACGVELIRGGVSEISPKDGKIELWAEDSFLKKNLRLEVDMVVLVMGATAQKSNAKFAKSLDLKVDKYNYFVNTSRMIGGVAVDSKNVFVVGCASSVKSVEESLHDAQSAALGVMNLFSLKN